MLNFKDLTKLLESVKECILVKEEIPTKEMPNNWKKGDIQAMSADSHLWIDYPDGKLRPPHYKKFYPFDKSYIWNCNGCYGKTPIEAVRAALNKEDNP